MNRSNEPMGMILAAGLGRRLQPLTFFRAKPAIPFLNRPLIRYTLELFKRARIEDIVINLHHLPESVVEAVGEDYPRVVFSHEKTTLGTAGALNKVHRILEGKTLVIANGKIYFEQDLREAIQFHEENGSLATLVLVPYFLQASFNPVLLDQDHNVVGFGSDNDSVARWATGPHYRPGGPSQPLGAPNARVSGYKRQGHASSVRPYIFTGVHILSSGALDFIPEGVSDTVKDLYPRLISEGKSVRGFISSAHWCECSLPSQYLSNSLELLARNGLPNMLQSQIQGTCHKVIAGQGVRISSGSRLERCVVWDGVKIGPGNRLSDVIITGNVTLAKKMDLHKAVITPILEGNKNKTAICSRVEGANLIWDLSGAKES